MDTDIQDKARKLTDQLRESQRKGAKETTFAADQTKILIKAYDELSAVAASASKNIRELGKELSTVTEAFENPASTFSDILHDGLKDGQGLLKTFSAIAGLMFDGPIKNANKALDKEKAILADLEKARQTEIKTGEDSVKNLEEKLKKEKDFCDKVTKCDESKIKSLEEQIKKEGENVTKQKEGGALDDESIKDQKTKIEKAEQFLNKQKATAEVVKKLIANFADAFDRFVELDNAAADFRKELGLGRDAARQLEQTALQLNQQFVTLGVTIQGAYKSLIAIGQVLGTSLLINKELAQTTALLAANYGVNEKTAAGFLQKMSAIGGMTDKQASAMAGFTANLANAAGVNLDEVMNDVANASDDTVTLMRGNVKQMTLAAIQAKQMGVSLDRSASSAKGLLNFTQSVSDEMEASVLLGKNLNLNAARQLSFQGDVAGAQKEILNQVRQMGDFNKMNVFQQEALAKATGYSAVELTKMLKNEEKLAQLSDKEKASYEKALEAMKEQNEETGKDLLMKTQMQSSMAQLSNTFQAFKQILADILTPVVNVAVKLLIPALKLALLVFNLILVPVKVLANALYKLFEPIEPVVQDISDAFDGINGKIEEAVQYLVPFGVAILKIVAPIDFIFRTFRMISPIVRSIGSNLQTFGGTVGKIGNFVSSLSNKMSLLGKGGSVLTPIFTATMRVFGKIARFASTLMPSITGFITGFGSASGVVGKFASGFGKVLNVVKILGTAGKAIPIVGEIIMVLQAAYGMITRLMSGMGFFEALGETLYDVFVGPFEMLVELLTEIPIIGDLFKPLLAVFPVIKSSISDVFKNFQSGWESIKDLFSGKDIVKNLLNIGKMFLMGIYTVPLIIFKSIVGIFPSIFETILNGVKSFGSILYTVFIQPFVSAWNFISDLFVGNSNSTLGDGIIKGLIGVGSAILSIFTSPFEFIFGMIMKGFSSIGQFIQNVLSVPFKIVGKLIGVDTGGINAGADAAAGPQENVIAAIEQTNQKLDTLINLMMSGGIAVNLDGRKVSEQLAIASS